MKLLVKEMIFRDGYRVRPGTVIEWDPAIKVPSCCEVLEDDTPGKVRQKPGPKPKPKEPETFAQLNAENAKNELKPWAAAKPQ